MGRFILCIDDSTNAELWSEVAQCAHFLYGFHMCIAADILRLNKKRIKVIKERVTEGHEVCSHTTSHISLEDISERRAVFELESSKEIIGEIFETECETIIYPFGLYGEDTIELANKLGYKYGRAIGRRMFRPPPKKLNNMLVGSINIPRDASDRSVEEAVGRWIQLAYDNDWTVCLFGHGACDFGVDEWKRLLYCLYEARTFVEVITFKEL